MSNGRNGVRPVSSQCDESQSQYDEKVKNEGKLPIWRVPPRVEEDSVDASLEVMGKTGQFDAPHAIIFTGLE
jgi:hypothetical protein